MITSVAAGISYHDLGGHGFLITDTQGGLVGKVATARLSTEEIAQQRRAQFRLVTSQGHKDE